MTEENACAIELYSDMKEIGTFPCSDERINQLQKNIVTSLKANFVDIPTDCPQRDERCGWIGDIAVFAPTVAFNMDTTSFMKKWLRDVTLAQTQNGCIILVPWAVYRSTGDREILSLCYESMKRWVDYEARMSRLLSIGDSRYIWSLGFHYGDWLAP